MNEKIKIDIVADVVCPWCAVGYRKLKNAIEELNLEDKVEIEWQPFELNPDMPKEGKDANQYSIDKYRLTKEKLEQSRNRVKKSGEEVGFKFNFYDGMRIVNTLDAHILLDYAKEFNKQTLLEVRLSTAFFSEKKDISDRNILSLELQSVGLDAEEALSRLDSYEKREKVKNRAKTWLKKGINGVPTMIFNDDITLNGALPISTYKQVLTEIIEQKEN